MIKVADKAVKISEDLSAYIFNTNESEHALLQSLREETLKLENGIMMSPPEQIAYFSFLTKFLKPRRILELGTFTGYCTLAMAFSSDKECKIVTCDNDKTWPEIGKSYWEKSGLSEKIRLMLGSAINSLDHLIQEGEKFDFIFIDADKVNYWNYFVKSLDILSSNGLIIVDNVFWGGRVIDSKFNDFQTVAIREFNKNLKNFPGINYCVLPIGDGLTLVSKKNGDL